jgi:hypothetical protein
MELIARSCLACSPVSSNSTILPLAIVISLTLVKEAFEDLKRDAKDREVRTLKAAREAAAAAIGWEDMERELESYEKLICPKNVAPLLHCGSL